ncbi:hypothetical protein MPTK1_7g15750 [Marchantia polymorpha subsp. ruderalis]|uniref:Uncharacterized protein n=2 Tax=Marchantia polymorpha TaxID=3197 RepID=A0A176VSK6_MARPO|nr:hypothetical protein AXG93_2053s1020 [Marchantia polymorpha subsp. ruderalis]PTQ31488.1 hypothetical protein MARPO_0111s0044 [Marchantia polymorpha]BBN17614.1 hypothetical protein Mp_7g15750 [Marchantia polymorpha subsp. ruderalis]|eukprot:PTQ31488.1 hypothetical protein MARPO_0111s0044 [Marchantia polymorpha]
MKKYLSGQPSAQNGGGDEENAGDEGLCQLETPNNCVQGEKVTTDSDTEDNAFTFRRMGSTAARLYQT